MLLGELVTPAALQVLQGNTKLCQSHDQETEFLTVLSPEKPYPATTVSVICCSYFTHINTPGQVKEVALVLFGFGIVIL